MNQRRENIIGWMMGLVMWGCFGMTARAQMFTNIRATQTMTIKAIVEDERQCIWFASGKSLNCFDGQRIRTLSNDILDRLGAINCILPLPEDLLVGCERGMVQVDPESGDCKEVAELEGRNVRSLLWAAGHEWVGTDSVLYRDRLPIGKAKDVRAMCNLKNGVLMAVSGGLQVISHDGKTLHEVFATNTPFTLSFFPEKDGDEILAGMVNGLLHIDVKQKKAVADPFFLPVVKCLMRDDRGVLMLGCDGGLFECDDELKPIHHDARNPRSFAGNVVWCMMKDHAGNLWIGSDNGLSVMASDQSFVIYSLASITESGQGNQIYCIHKDSEGRTWIGGTNGIVRVDAFGHNDQSHVWYAMGNPDNPLLHNRIRQFYEDPVWGMWACTDGGLLHFDESTEQWVNCPIPEDAHNWVYTVEREEDALLVNTFDGVYRLWLDDETVAVRDIQPVEAKTCLEYQYGMVMVGDTEWKLTSNGLVVRNGAREHRIDLPEKFVSIYYHAAEDRIYLGGADQFAVIRPKEFLQRKARGLWFDPEARFVEDTDDNRAFSRRVVAALCVALVALVVVLVLYFLQRRRLKMERARRQAMLKSAADKMALLEHDNSSLHQQLRLQHLAVHASAGDADGALAQEVISVDEQYLLRVNKVIEEHIDNPDFSVTMLSEIMGVSKKQLYRKIKQYSDLTAVEYIRKLRLQKAASLMQNPAFTINEVMYMVGFSNPSYFSRTFATEFGMTPTEYRNRK